MGASLSKPLTRHQLSLVQQYLDQIQSRAPPNLLAEYSEMFFPIITELFPSDFVPLVDENNPHSPQFCLALYREIVNGLEQLLSEGIYLRRIRLDDIKMDPNSRSTNTPILRFRPPKPCSLVLWDPSAQVQILKNASFLQELALVFYLVAINKKTLDQKRFSEGRLLPLLHELEDEGIRSIIEWMWRVEREWGQTELLSYLRELYYKLDMYASSLDEGNQMEMVQEQPQQQWYKMVEMDLFADTQPIFYVGRQDRAAYLNPEQHFQVEYEYRQPEILQIRLKHKTLPISKTLQLHFHQLPPFLQSFLQKMQQEEPLGRVYSPMKKLYKLIIKTEKIALVSPAGKFILTTHVNWTQLYQIDTFYQKVASRRHQMIAFNNSDHYRMLFEAKVKPFQKLPPQMKAYLKDHCGFLKKMALDLLKEKKYVEAAEIFRCLIETQYQLKSPNASQFKGRGRDEDMLDLLATLKTGDNLFLFQQAASWDCLFICEYLGIYSQRSYEWYQYMNNKYRFKKAIIYGLLNFCYQNEQLDVPLIYIKCWHKLLQCRYQSDSSPSEPIKTLLANIAYFKLGDTALARKLANQILVENTLSIPAKKLLYITSDLSHRNYYLQQLLREHPHYEFTYLQGFQYLKKKQIQPATQSFQDCLTSNAYFRPAYYGLLQVMIHEMREEVQFDNWWMKFSSLRAELQNKCPKDAYLSYKIWEMVKERTERKYQIKVEELQTLLIVKNPTFKPDNIKLCSYRMIQQEMYGRNPTQLLRQRLTEQENDLYL